MRNFPANILSIAGAKQSLRRKTRAQSLVEFAITLPILIILFTGMVEFGFMLNAYLSVQDAARSTARRYSTINPFDADETIRAEFFQDAAQYAVDQMAPPSDPDARRIDLDPAFDNVLVSLIGVEVDESTDPNSIRTIRRFAPIEGASHYRLFNATNPPTRYENDRITELMTTEGEPVDSGFVIIEIHYGYKGTLNLPWTLPFMSPTQPAMMYVSVIMPTIYTKPLLDSG